MTAPHEGSEPNPYAAPAGGSTPGATPAGPDASTTSGAAYGTPAYPDRQGGYPSYPATTGRPPAYPPAGGGAQGYYPTGYGEVPTGELAGWGARVVANILDSLLNVLGALVWMVGVVMFSLGIPGDDTVDGETTHRAGNTALALGGGVVALIGFALLVGLWIWNRLVRQGRTGQSWGKKVMGLRLIDERTGRPIGAGMCFVRELAHYLDSLPIDLGYLWPLWDSRRQTFADKLCHTVVVRAPKG